MRTIAVLALLAGLPAAAGAQPVQTIHRFAVPAMTPLGGLVETPDGSLYGTTANGGAGGAIYRVAPGGGAVTIVASFDSGRSPDSALVRAADGAIYGTTRGASSSERGTIFRFDPATGRIVTLHTFAGNAEGLYPAGRLLADADGLLYGNTEYGDGGTVYSLDPVTGRLRTLHRFALFDPLGVRPTSGVVRHPDGFLYGLVDDTAASDRGGIVRTDAATGATTLVHAFAAGGPQDPASGLTLAPDGRLYGTSLRGGMSGAGTIFRFAPATSTLEVLHQFSNTDGRLPYGRLVRAADGSFYGATLGGDAPVVAATLFRLRPAGGGFTFSTVATFDPAVTGRGALADLLLASDGWIYGANESGGAGLGGTVFRLDTLDRAGAGNPPLFEVVHAFDLRTNGWTPWSPPVQATDGLLYGMTRSGGAANRGVVYRLDPVTGAFTALASVPPPTSDPIQGSSNSEFVDGGDGHLYGTVAGGTTGLIVRVTPSSGAVTTVLTRTPMTSFSGFVNGLVRVAGQLYLLTDESGNLVLQRFDPVAATLTPVATSVAGIAPFAPTAQAIAGHDGNIYVTASWVTLNGRLSVWFNRVVRVNPATGTVTQLVSDQNQPLASRAAQRPDGSVAYVGRSGTESRLKFVEPATGAVRDGCATPGYGNPTSLVAAADGTVLLVAYRNLFGPPSLFRCPDGAATAVRIHDFPPAVRFVSPLTTAPSGLVYGATDDGSLGGGTIFRVAAVGATPVFDADADGLADDWEERYGLSPSTAAGADGPGGDPDGDGVTNDAEEAAGSHPRGTFVRYLAEGANNAFFTTRIALVNDGLSAATVLLRFQTDATTTVPLTVSVPPTSRRTIDAAGVPGLEGRSFSTVVEADVRLAVERTMAWGAAGYGSHTETAVAAPATTWYFAEGSTSGDFALFYLLQNPQATAVTATVRFLRPSNQPPVDRQFTLPPFSRTTIPVDADAVLANTDVSAIVSATAPIIAERAMYFSKPGQPFVAGHDSAGVTAPALDWFLAEGATGPFFDLFLLVANPNPMPANVTVDYLLAGGGVLTKSYTVGANARLTVWVDDEQLPAGSGQRPLANTPVSLAVRSTNAVPIVVERTMWWPGPETAADFWYETHNSPGTTTTATRWAIGDGEIAGPTFAETYVLIANPGSTPGRALVRLYFENGNTTGRFYDLPANSRTSVAVGAAMPEAAEYRALGATVESVGASPVPIVVERATYASPSGVTWSSGGNALATPIP